MLVFISVLVSVAAVLLLALLLLSVYIFAAMFNKRYNGNKDVKYFIAQDFEGLLAEPIRFVSDKGQLLHGFIYRSAKVVQPGGVIIFSHGFGAGHQAYTTEINALAQAGYYVLAYDNTGCVASEGKKLRGFDQGPIDLEYAVRYASNESRFKNLKIILVGHSWGAFSVMNALNLKGVSGAVAICGFISGARVLAQNSIGKVLPAEYLVAFFLRILNFFRFGTKANRNSIRSLKKTDKPVCLIYGTSDTTVKFKSNGAVMLKKLKDKKNIHIKVIEGKGHNPYLTCNAEKYMNDTFATIAKVRKKDPEQAKKLYNDIDYHKMTEEDNEVMSSILDFCNKVIASE